MGCGDNNLQFHRVTLDAFKKLVCVASDSDVCQSLLFLTECFQFPQGLYP
jgi:hypothetical protein